MHGRGRPPVRVAIVTLDNHLKGAVERANAELGRDHIAVSLHAASDWEREDGAYDRALEAIEKADIIIATMLFLDDHIRMILPALEQRREDCDAIVCLMSAGEVVKLTRMGGYDMSKPAKGVMSLLKKLRGSKKEGSSSGAGQMKMLRRLPKILRFIPGTAQDVRAYFLTLQFWLAGSDENVVAMVRGLIDRYASGDRLTRRGMMVTDSPIVYPELGVYHPNTAQRISESLRLLPRKKGQEGSVGLLLLRSYLLGRDTGHYDAAIDAFEEAGLKVVPVFASGLDARPAIEKFFIGRDGKPSVDAIVNLTGFSLVGGPAYNDAEGAVSVLTDLNVPYLAAHALEFQSVEEWRKRDQGLLPLETTMMVSIPELDGAIAPSIYGGRSSKGGEICEGCARRCKLPDNHDLQAMQGCPERASALAAKVVKLVRLKKSPRADRKVGIVLFNFPPNAGATGTAAFLAVFESLYAVLKRLSAEGYSVEVPDSVDSLREKIVRGNSDRFGSDANVAGHVSADEHVHSEPHLAEIEKQWGPSPGKQQVDGSGIQILGAHFGNIFVGIQPAFGYEGDPVRLLFDGTFTPTHAFSAFYRWLREDYGADALVHFGTHGALEFMPGKQSGMSGDCWPERLIQDLPNYYLYAANNPSEGIVAKRRSGATLISYLTPPLSQAGLHKGLAELKASLERWRSMEPGEERERLELLLDEQAESIGVSHVPPEQMAETLYELETALIPNGLHILGELPTDTEISDWKASLTECDPNVDTEDFITRLGACDEIGGLIHALDAGYVLPAPGGDILTNPEVLPTGRNIHGFDPFRIPSRFACEQGAQQAEELLERHKAGGGGFPQSLAMVLWGADNLKSEGVQIGQALRLIGAKPRIDGYGRLAGAELIPLEELGRPRIDVIMTLSGIFRDLLPLQTRMLAEASLLAAQADEPLEMNFIRKHSLAHQSAHQCDFETASLRVFSNAEGAYGANVNQLIDGGVWADPDELANAFETQKGFAYGLKGEPVAQRALLRSALADVELSYQNLESVEVGITDLDQYFDGLGGINRSITRARGSEAPVYILDSTQGRTKVRTLAEQIGRETQTRTLNPKWFEGMLKHGYEGVKHIEGNVTNTMGWSATTGEVEPWIYQKISETFVLDKEMRERLSNLNPQSSARVANRLIEACERRLWEPDDETLEALHQASNDLEDRLEGVMPE
jgi:magnesium chelatase subunit H